MYGLALTTLGDIAVSDFRSNCISTDTLTFQKVSAEADQSWKVPIKESQEPRIIKAHLLHVARIELRKESGVNGEVFPG